MDATLVAGCAVGGLVIGAVLDTFSGRIVRPPEEPNEDRPVDQVSSLGAPAVSSAVAVVETRQPEALEIGASAVLTAAVFGLLAARLGAVSVLAVDCALMAGLVAAAVVDARAGIVPRQILFPTFAVVAVGLLAASAVDDRWRALAGAAIGGAVAFGVFFALWWFFPRGIGYGDVRLAGVMGVALGWLGAGEVYVGFLAAFAIGAVVGVTIMVRRGSGRRTRFAFGPALVAGTAVGLLWGQWAVHLWLHRG